jgi:hypothetical protein
MAPHAERYQHAMHDLMVRIVHSADAREELQEFLDKRAPRYTGR